MVVLNLLVNRQCNLHCGYCHVDSLPRDDPAPVMTVEQVNFILKCLEQEDVELVHVFGGEPFVHPAIKQVCDLIHDAGHPLNIATNGTLLLPHLGWLKAMRASISVNLVGDDPRIEPCTDFSYPLDAAMAGSRAAVETGLDVNGIVCVFPVAVSSIDNARFYKDYLDRVHHATGIKDFFLLYFSRLGRGKDAWDRPGFNRDFYRADNWLLFLKILKALLSKAGAPYGVFVEPAFEVDAAVMPLLPPTYLQCEMIVRENLVITPDMNAHMCLLMASIDDPAYRRPFDGNVARLQAFMQDAAMEAVPRLLGGCRTCKERSYCGPCTSYVHDASTGRDYRCKGNTGKETLMGCPLATARLW